MICQEIDCYDSHLFSLTRGNRVFEFFVFTWVKLQVHSSRNLPLVHSLVYPNLYDSWCRYANDELVHASRLVTVTDYCSTKTKMQKMSKSAFFPLSLDWNSFLGARWPVPRSLFWAQQISAKLQSADLLLFPRYFFADTVLSKQITCKFWRVSR